MELMDGPGEIVRVKEFEVTPPVRTVICAVPELATREAGTEAVTCVEFWNVLERGEPFHCTTASEPKPLPFTVSVKAALPAVTVLGLIAPMVGPTTTEKFNAFDVTPPVVKVIGNVPALATSEDGTDAVT